VSARIERLCGESEAVAALLRGKCAEDLRAAIHHMALCWRFSPADLELALRHAAQCRHWRKADAAWARYVEGRERLKALDPGDVDYRIKWLKLFDANEQAFSEYQRHYEAANKLWNQERTS
jgi:hypothetical protein